MTGRGHPNPEDVITLTEKGRLYIKLSQTLNDYEGKLAFVKDEIRKQEGISPQNRKLLFEYYRRIDSEFWDIDIPSTLRDRARRYLDSIKRLEHLCGYVVKTA